MPKSPTGIAGFDDIAMGGIPTGRTTLVSGGPDFGKTVFALQKLAYGASELGASGTLVAFEQGSDVLSVDAAAFDWGLDALSDDQLFFIDARPNLDLTKVGSFDIGGMLALHLAGRLAGCGQDRTVCGLCGCGLRSRGKGRVHQLCLASRGDHPQHAIPVD